MRKWLSSVSLLVTTVALASGCNSGVGQGGGGSGGLSFRSCEAIGFSSQNVADIYYSALTDRSNGYDYYGETQAAANSCASSCYYEAVCANGCTSCALDIIDAAYSKSQVAPAKSASESDSALGVTIENIISSD